MTERRDPVASRGAPDEPRDAIDAERPAPDGDSGTAGAHFDAVLDNLVDHAVMTLDIAGNITSWNRGAQKTTGYRAEDAIGRHFSCFYTDQDRAAGVPEQALERAITGGMHASEGWRVRQDNSLFWASAVVQPLVDRYGLVRGFVKVTRDMSERMQVEKLRDELHQAQKHEMVGQLTAGVAHDFNNLLTAIDASYQLIKKYASDAHIERVLEVNKVAIDRSKKLIAQLLAFSRKQVLKPRLSNINELILAFDFLLERTVGERNRIQWDLQADIPMVEVDRSQFQSVLLHLVVNARDAMPHGGEITVFTEVVHLDGSSAAPPDGIPAGRYVVMGVSDTGSGMSPSVRARAIEPFFTTKETGKGSGLGLSQSYGFARQSGGTLTIESEEGVGTTFRIILPAAVPAGRAVTAKQDITVLLVEDDVAIRSMVGEMLRLHGHNVIEAGDALEALDQLQRDVPIDYLFTDVIMPNDMNGVDLVNAARTLRPGLPALLASGYPRDALRYMAHLPDDISFLQKPYSINDLLMRMASIGRARDAGTC